MSEAPAKKPPTWEELLSKGMAPGDYTREEAELLLKMAQSRWSMWAAQHPQMAAGIELRQVWLQANVIYMLKNQGRKEK